MRIVRALPASILAILVLLASGCTGGSSPSGPTAASSTEAPSPPVQPAPSPAGSEPPFLPRPDVPLPSDPAQIARALVRVTGALRASIDRWREEGSGSATPPSDVVLQALYQQRLYRLLPRHPPLARSTIARLPARLRDEARTIVRASSLLTGLVPISKPSAFRTGRPEPPARLLGYYRQAERRFGIDWEVLAALNYVESKFGRVKSTSYAGAQGPMQFIPSTWAAYGLGGDIQDPHDAILGAANYLRRSGAPGDYRRALYAYNHAWPYVDAILIYARRMRADVRWFFTLYNWQVFVLTTKGDRRLTGPGLGSSG